MIVGFPKLRASDLRLLEKLKRMPDSQIDYSDIPEARPQGWQRRNPVLQKVTVQLDEDVTAWLCSLGKRAPGRVNSILRAAMKSSSNA